MKVLGWKAVLVLVLSMIVWWAMYSAFPSAPPDPADSTVIVGVMLVVVLGTSSLLKRLRNLRASPAAQPAAATDAAASVAESAT